jgi:hypothetical protein
MQIGDRVMVKTEKGYWPGRIWEQNARLGWVIQLDKVPGRHMPKHESHFPDPWRPIRYAQDADLLPMGQAVSGDSHHE